MGSLRLWHAQHCTHLWRDVTRVSRLFLGVITLYRDADTKILREVATSRVIVAV
jgi:hypothetical protein